MNLTDAVGQSTANMTDEEFAILKRLVEKQDREAAQVTVTPVSAVQHCIPRSLTPEISIDTRICTEIYEGKMDPEPTELESPSAGTGLETSGQQCPPNGETGRTTADGYLLVGIGSNQGGDTSSPTEHVGTRVGRTTTTTSAASNITFLQQGHKPRGKIPSEENKQFDPGGKGEKPPLWNAAVMVLVFFPGGNFGPWEARCLCFVFFVCVYLSVCSLFIVLSGHHCSAS